MMIETGRKKSKDKGKPGDRRKAESRIQESESRIIRRRITVTDFILF
jgi:hypothetical protein